MQNNMSILPLMTFHTKYAGTAKLTRQICAEKRVLIQINKRPVPFEFIIYIFNRLFKPSAET